MNLEYETSFGKKKKGNVMAKSNMRESEEHWPRVLLGEGGMLLPTQKLCWSSFIPL